MRTNLLNKPETSRRPKMASAAVVALDEARARVIASRPPSLKELCAKLGGWDVAELSGHVAKRTK